MTQNSQSASNKPHSAVLLIHCPDRKGLILAVTEFIKKNNGNILYLGQHVDAQKSQFFMRIEWDLQDFVIPTEKIGEYFDVLLARKFNMQWKLYFSGRIPRMAIFVSKLPHCLYDILSRCQCGEWDIKVPVIISNHANLEKPAKQFGVDFYHFPMTQSNKLEQEKKQLEILQKLDIDFVVLARYMQILSADFVARYPNKIINIHHSFLPAFPGAKPYQSAYERGVKIIGATSHYVTADLDGGPIIEQDVVRVSHADSIKDFVRKGRDLERVVLARAIWSHVQRKILVSDNRTVVFN